MATLKTKIEVSSSDFFSQKLNLSTSLNATTSGDDRAFSVDRVPLGVRSSMTLTQAETALANMHNKTIVFTDDHRNSHEITFSSSYANSPLGATDSGSLTILSTVLATWDNKTLILNDNSVVTRTLTMTFDKDVTTTVRGTCTASATAYTVGLSGLTTTTAIRDRITTAFATIYAAGDFSVVATDSTLSSVIINLKQTRTGATASPTIRGTAESSTLLSAIDMTGGGLGYSSSIAGISNNAATTTAHLLSLRNSILLAKEEGKLLIDIPVIPTASSMILYQTGPYVNDSRANLPTGTAITASEITVAAFAGGAVPLQFECGEFNSPHQKVYMYLVNKSGSGTVNLYIKDTSNRSEGTITSSQADTSGIAVDKTLTLISSKGITYTFTSIAPDAATANTRTSDTAYVYGDGDTMQDTIINLQKTFKLVDNKANREVEPFTISLDSTLIMRVKTKDIDGGTLSNQSIAGTLIAEGIISTTGIVGGVDTYHLFARLAPKEFVFMPLVGTPKLYADAEDALSEVEYLTLEA